MSTPDLTPVHVIHRGMRADSARLRDALTALAPVERRRLAALTRWYAGFRAELISHHEVEDEIAFPAIAERVPGFAEALARLDGDHHRLHAVIEAMSVALDDLAHSNGDWVAARHRAVALACELHASLMPHLDYEDAEILPLISRTFTAEEWQALDEKAKDHLDMRQLPFVVSWLGSHATEDERDHLLGEAPLVFRLIWRASKGRYAKLAEQAFRPAVVTAMVEAA